jgi:hypothetical protein
LTKGSSAIIQGLILQFRSVLMQHVNDSGIRTDKRRKSDKTSRNWSASAIFGPATQQKGKMHKLIPPVDHTQTNLDFK